ncbi:MAG TPA: DUF2528 domain-containing protein [Pseudomonas sp.]|jgi:hypothetical protein|uniref:Single-stranded DNA-binding protein n=1 Tax=Halopseudomonas oceani TaxID=1708783 RepID=A0A2P4EU81_9GAMM|nr:DUF2528 family protein [Halopseudomonas oceani]MAQ52001.1 single-stranded DNA-binding protein [Pseudomonas sp.]MBB49193.1 single-stranded DNA-binding protein [Pseudomonadales bacterium]MBF77494.1 single-stranded DNA-binding protein [Pseudomonadales bacterium]POB02994.1 single-stranded DNA-binding protein [Halopseudomonas oceani]GGE50367.1 hypothetical protein GCM10007421_25840 [Halopseudomonas oceani]|tara:strand:- start:3380 stop:3835 length:456 start_codon:yes stop_codon:yes gene_type:complete
MQATQPNSGTEQATTDGNIKRYKVSETFGEFEVRLEVDHSILTPARAKEINEFWGSPEDRIAAEKGDEVKAVIRLAGSRAAAMIISDGWGGASFGSGRPEAGEIWSKQFRAQEGWGGEEDTPFGWCGIRIIAADVEMPGFDDFELKEVARG